MASAAATGLIYSCRIARSYHSKPFTHYCKTSYLSYTNMKVVYVVSLLALVAYCEAYGDGAPESACKDMIPRHPVEPQKSPAPYFITTNTKTVKAGTPLQVTIAGKGAKDTIKGLMLQARVGDKPVGTFKVDPSDPLVKLLNCGTAGNTVTHKRHPAKDDKQSITLTWNPPADLNDNVKFRATIALNGAVFWVGVESAPIKVTL